MGEQVPTDRVPSRQWRAGQIRLRYKFRRRAPRADALAAMDRSPTRNPQQGGDIVPAMPFGAGAAQDGIGGFGPVQFLRHGSSFGRD